MTGRSFRSRLPVLAALASGALVLSACATETAYRPATGTGYFRTGYSDRQVEPGRFLVSFGGNSYTARETVEQYLLFRAAELTVQNGGDYFVMVDRDTDRQTRTYTTPGIGGGFGGGWGRFGGGLWGPSWRYYGRGFGWRGWDPYWGDPFWDRSVDIRQVDRYEASAEIVIGKGPKPRDNVRAFDARAVMATIGPSIVVPK